ncbi:MAG: hypothetical protein M1818_001303 [Claussenomyces sp. TS43310]|nr:MAG: hypothetical protein M1818_001303 [Claussenomyces sp. TS43310]
MPPVLSAFRPSAVRVVGSSLGKAFPRRNISSQELDRTRGDRERIVILGSGWAGYTLSRQLDPRKFQAVVVSPRSYFVFTPLLASTAVGTLEFRTTLEPVRRRNSGVQFVQGWADAVDFSKKRLVVEESAVGRYNSVALTADPGHTPAWPSVPDEGAVPKGKLFELEYDKLVIAVGCYSQTFGTKGVRENALFLKDVGDSRQIRKRILDCTCYCLNDGMACFETAALPSTSEELKRQMLNFAIVGGGPTGVEFAAELFDLCNEDLKKIYPGLVQDVRISIYDVAPQILSMFDKSLADYAVRTFSRDGIKVKTEHHIEELRRGLPGFSEDAEEAAGCLTLKTKEDGEIGIGMCVWSTGLMMNPFVQKALNTVHTYPTSSCELSDPSADIKDLQWKMKRHPKTGGLLIDDHFRVKLIAQQSAHDDASTEATMKDVFALGDVSVLEKGMLPATAQVANQEAQWLAKRLNKGDLEQQPFSYRNLGVMTYLGNWKAIMQTGGNNEITGWAAWVIWRGAYLTQTISWRNKILIPIYWAINWIFGRDISRF